MGAGFGPSCCWRKEGGGRRQSEPSGAARRAWSDGGSGGAGGHGRRPAGAPSSAPSRPRATLASPPEAEAGSAGEQPVQEYGGSMTACHAGAVRVGGTRSLLGMRECFMPEENPGGLGARPPVDASPPLWGCFQRDMSLKGGASQAALGSFSRIVANSLSRASLSRCAASLSLSSCASASSCAKSIPGRRQASAPGSDFSFS